MRTLGLLLALSWSLGCAQVPSPTADSETAADTAFQDSADGTEIALDPSSFATSVLSFTPGEAAGFGAKGFPEIVLGRPEGAGDHEGSLDVLSLGRSGEIILGFDRPILDGDGMDLIVFENPFANWYEPGIVGVSLDLVEWLEWPCDPSDPERLFEGCAGRSFVWANSENELDPTDPEQAGGDAFDLALLGLTQASYLRVRDGGSGSYADTTGGFDLDAVALVHPAP